MTEEYFDIVDENNEPMGEKAMRSEAHTKGLWHRTVHIYLYRRHGKTVDFLIHLRAKDKDLHPNHWDTRFGGHIKAGQTVEEATVSEVKEEVSINISYEYLLKGNVIKSQNYPNNEFTYPFFLEFEHEDNLIFNDGEVQRVEWMLAEDVVDSMRNSERPWSSSPEGFQSVYQMLIDQL